MVKLYGLLLAQISYFIFFLNRLSNSTFANNNSPTLLSIKLTTRNKMGL